MCIPTNKLELFSISPGYYMHEAYVPGQKFPDTPEEQAFHDHKILGSLVITHPKIRRQLAQELIQNFHQPGNSAECFQPHHGLRIYDKGTTADLVLCFDCGRMERYGIDADDVHVSENVPPLFYTLFRDWKIPYTGPRPDGFEDEEKSTTETKVR